ncbi:MAG TPA: sigma-70 family RNA polymerase sigma factor [Candidatus Acidoferrum sp.]|nr:sigma-70 family RNA polymerase sigma factor [Candidatus Acidoferrum sp.]
MKPATGDGKKTGFLRRGNFFRPNREIQEKAEDATQAGRYAVAGETRIAAQETDELLLRRAAKGDEDAFALLYRRHQGALYRFALRMTGSAWGAEEIVQDVFMTLIREPKKYDPERGSVGALLYGIARNRVMKHLERTPREIPLEEKNEDGTGGGIVLQDNYTPAKWAEARERLQHVRAAVQELPAEFREAVVLCELEELSYEEAAKLMDCPIGTIRSRLHRGRALLLAKLEILKDVPRRWKAAR